MFIYSYYQQSLRGYEANKKMIVITKWDGLKARTFWKIKGQDVRIKE